MQVKNLSGISNDIQTVFLRVDYNVPLNDQQQISDTTRIDETVPTIEELLKKNKSLVICSHLGRPDGKALPELSLKPIAKYLSEKIGREVIFVENPFDGNIQKAMQESQTGKIYLLENIRFWAEEEKNDSDFSAKLGSLAQVFVNDAFATAHRKHSSTFGVGEILPSFAGLLMEKEIKGLDPFLNDIKHPLTLIMGGAKIDSKIGIIENYIDKADNFVFGGGLANTFLLAAGKKIGASKSQPEHVETAHRLLETLQAKGKKVFLPTDYVTATVFNKDAASVIKSPDQITDQDMILDIGPQTADQFIEVINQSKMIIWNGPMGVYEFEGFRPGTSKIAWAVANAKKAGIASCVGGGDSLDAINMLQIPVEDYAHLSTGGGAMLEYLEGKELPGITQLIIR